MLTLIPRSSRYDLPEVGRTRRLMMLSQANLQLAAEDSAESALGRVAELGRQIVDADRGLVWSARGTNQAGRLFRAGFSPLELPTAMDQQLLELVAQWEAAGVASTPLPEAGLLGQTSGRSGSNLLWVPLQFQTDGFGALGICRQASEPPFTRLDAQTLELFAAQSAAAIRNLRLLAKLQRLAILEEQDRIAKELHDGVIQSIYAIGLNLEDLGHLVETSPQEVRRQLEETVNSLNNLIRDLRSSIFDLGPLNAASVSLAAGLEHLAREYRVHSLLEPELRLDGVESLHLSANQRSGLFRIAREALANASKHARASRVVLSATQRDGYLSLAVQDNGQGFNPQDLAPSRRRGLQEAQELAQELGGALTLSSAPGQGTTLRVDLPINASPPPQG